MADSAQRALTIAHHLPAAFASLLQLPPHSTVSPLPLGQGWAEAAEAEILITAPPRGQEAHLPAEPPPGWPGKLRWVHAVSAGMDEYPAWIYQVPLVTCGRGTNSAAIAEFTLAAMLAVEKQLPDIWIHRQQDWKLSALGTLRGKTLGLLGFGSIGQEIARLGAAFGMEVLAFRRSGGEVPGARLADFKTVLSEADHLVVALPLTSETAGIIGAKALAGVKKGAHLVNIARGKLIDQPALLEALDNGQLSYASLDVTEPEPLPDGHPLYAHPRVHLSPHISFSGGDRSRGMEIFQENLELYLRGQTLQNIVSGGRGY